MATRLTGYPAPIIAPTPCPAAEVFETARTLGLAMPDVKAGTKYDGSPVLKRGGSFMAGLATHPSAEPGTIVVRADLDSRALLIAEAPQTYYVTDHYRRHPVVLVRLSTIDRETLRDVLTMSWRLTASKTG